MAHAVVDDDAYEGFRIPKGAGEFSATSLSDQVFKFVLACRCYLHNECVVRFFHIRSKSDLDNAHFLNDDGSLKPDDVEHIVYGFG